MTPYGSSKKNRRFGKTYRLHLQGNDNLNLPISHKYMARGGRRRKHIVTAPPQLCLSVTVELTKTVLFYPTELILLCGHVNFAVMLRIRELYSWEEAKLRPQRIVC
jgi:hypothetical protein